jgi:hypothetical protein
MNAGGLALDRLLSRKQVLESSGSTQPVLRARVRELRDWQAARLARTYRDFARDARHAKAVEFFLSDLYGSHDFRGRDSDIARALSRLRRALPQSLLEQLELAIELDVLSSELDWAVAEQLAPGAITASTYAAAYRAAGQRGARQRQIDLIIELGEALDGAVHKRPVGLALRIAHAPAHALGFGALQDFLERGFAAFKEMRDAKRLLGVIRERETQLSEAIFQGDAVALECLDRGAAA